ncbi:MAG: hypothetical protein GY817_05615, partial [bacterium]|nr:hypothetical protein [bacterium]
MDRIKNKLKKLTGHVSQFSLFKRDEERKHSVVIRRIAMFVLVAFITTSMHNFAYANVMPGQPKVFNLPSSVGKVVDSFQGQDKGKVVLIQDIHCNPQVQKNIYQILAKLKARYGHDFKTVGLEGTPLVTIDTSILSDLPQSNIKESIVEHLVKQGKVTGAEWYQIMNPNTVILKGIEDNDLYVKNFTSLYNSLWYRYELNDVFEEVSRGYDSATKYFYTEDAKKLSKQISIYEEGRLTFREYVDYLKATAKDYNINFVGEYPQLNSLIGVANIKDNINPSAVAIESEYVAKKISSILTGKEIAILKEYAKDTSEEYYLYLKDFLKKKNMDISKSYPSLGEYFRYLDASQKIDDILLLEEKEHLEYRLIEAMLADREDAIELLYSQHFVGIMKSYLWNEASINDVEEWEEDQVRIKRIKNFSDRLLRKPYFANIDTIFNEAVENMQEFYADAEKRNEVLARNILSRKFDRSQVSAMVLGGYHTDGIKNFLKSKGISYDVIVPSLEDFGGETLYLERLEDQAKWLAKAKGRKYAKLLKNSAATALNLYSEFFKGNISESLINKVIASLEVAVDSKEEREILNKALGKISKQEDMNDKKADKLFIEDILSLTPEQKAAIPTSSIDIFQEDISSKFLGKPIVTGLQSETILNLEINKISDDKAISKSKYLSKFNEKGADYTGVAFLKEIFKKADMKDAGLSKLEVMSETFRNTNIYKNRRNMLESNYLSKGKEGLIDTLNKGKTFNVLDSLILADYIFDQVYSEKNWHLRGIQFSIMVSWLVYGIAPQAGTAAGKTAATVMANIVNKLMRGDKYVGVIAVNGKGAVDNFINPTEKSIDLLAWVGVKFFDIDDSKMGNEALVARALLNPKILPIVTHTQYGHLFNSSGYILAQAARQIEAPFLDEAHLITNSALSYVKSGSRRMKAIYRLVKNLFQRVHENFYKDSSAHEKDDFTEIETSAQLDAAVLKGGKNKIFVVTESDLVKEATAKGILAVFKDEDRKPMAWSHRMEVEYGSQAKITKRYQVSMVSFGVIAFFGLATILLSMTAWFPFTLVFLTLTLIGGIAGVAFVVALSFAYLYYRLETNKDVTGYLDAVVKAFLYDRENETYKLVELPSDRVEDGYTHTIAPVSNGIDLDQQLGTVEQVLALALLFNLRHSRDQNVALERVDIPKQTVASTSRSEAFKTVNGWNYPTTATFNNELTKSILNVEVLNLGSVENIEYFKTLDENLAKLLEKLEKFDDAARSEESKLAIDDVIQNTNLIVDSQEKEALLYALTHAIDISEAKEAIWQYSEKATGKRVIINGHKIAGDSQKDRFNNEAKEIAHTIQMSYQDTATAQLLIVDDTRLMTETLKILKKSLSISNNSKAQYLLQLIKNRESYLNASDQEKANRDNKREEFLAKHYDFFQKMNIEIREKEALGKDTTSLVSKVKELKNKVCNFAKNPENGVMFEIIDPMTSDRIYQSSKYLALTQGLLFGDSQIGTGTDFKQTKEAGLTLHLADIHKLTDDDLAQRRGRVVRSVGNESIIHEYYVENRMLNTLKEELSVEGIGVYKTIFHRQKDEATLQVLSKYEGNESLIDSEYLRLLVKILSAKRTSENLLGAYSEQLQDKYLIEPIKEMISELKRPYGKAGQVRHIELAGRDNLFVEKIYNKFDLNNPIITIFWENEERTYARVEKKNIQKYITFNETLYGGTVYEYNSSEDRKNIFQGNMQEFGGDKVQRLDAILKDEVLSKKAGRANNELADKPLTPKQRIQDSFKQIVEEVERISKYTAGVLDKHIVSELFLLDPTIIDDSSSEKSKNMALEEFGEFIDSLTLTKIKQDPFQNLQNTVQQVQHIQRQVQTQTETRRGALLNYRESFDKALIQDKVRIRQPSMDIALTKARDISKAIKETDIQKYKNLLVTVTSKGDLVLYQSTSKFSKNLQLERNYIYMAIKGTFKWGLRLVGATLVLALGLASFGMLFVNKKYRNTLLELGISLIHPLTRNERSLALELGINYQKNKKHLINLTNEGRANTNGQNDEEIRGLITYLSSLGDAVLTQKEIDDKRNSVFSLVKDISKMEREARSVRADRILNPIASWLWTFSKILIIGYIVQYGAEIIGAIAESLSSSGADNSVTQAMHSFVRGRKTSQTIKLREATFFNPNILQKLKERYVLDGWASQGYTFSEFIRIVFKATKIDEEQKVKADKESSFIVNIIGGIFRQDKYSNIIFSDSDFIDGLIQIDLAVKKGDSRPGFKTGAFTAELNAISNYIIFFRDTDEGDDAFKVKQKAFFSDSYDKGIDTDSSLKRASKKKIDDFMINYKVSQNLGFIDTYVPKWLLRVGMFFMVLLTLAMMAFPVVLAGVALFVGPFILFAKFIVAAISNIVFFKFIIPYLNKNAQSAAINSEVKEKLLMTMSAVQQVGMLINSFGSIPGLDIAGIQNYTPLSFAMDQINIANLSLLEEIAGDDPATYAALHNVDMLAMFSGDTFAIIYEDDVVYKDSDGNINQIIHRDNGEIVGQTIVRENNSDGSIAAGDVYEPALSPDEDQNKDGFTFKYSYIVEADENGSKIINYYSVKYEKMDESNRYKQDIYNEGDKLSTRKNYDQVGQLTNIEEYEYAENQITIVRKDVDGNITSKRIITTEADGAKNIDFYIYDAKTDLYILKRTNSYDKEGNFIGYSENFYSFDQEKEVYLIARTDQYNQDEVLTSSLIYNEDGTINEKFEYTEWDDQSRELAANVTDVDGNFLRTETYEQDYEGIQGVKLTRGFDHNGTFMAASLEGDLVLFSNYDADTAVLTYFNRGMISPERIQFDTSGVVIPGGAGSGAGSGVGVLFDATSSALNPLTIASFFGEDIDKEGVKATLEEFAEMQELIDSITNNLNDSYTLNSIDSVEFYIVDSDEYNLNTTIDGNTLKIEITSEMQAVLLELKDEDPDLYADFIDYIGNHEKIEQEYLVAGETIDQAFIFTVFRQRHTIADINLEIDALEDGPLKSNLITIMDTRIPVLSPPTIESTGDGTGFSISASSLSVGDSGINSQVTGIINPAYEGKELIYVETYTGVSGNPVDVYMSADGLLAKEVYFDSEGKIIREVFGESYNLSNHDFEIEEDKIYEFSYTKWHGTSPIEGVVVLGSYEDDDDYSNDLAGWTLYLDEEVSLAEDDNLRRLEFRHPDGLPRRVIFSNMDNNTVVQTVEVNSAPEGYIKKIFYKGGDYREVTYDKFEYPTGETHYDDKGNVNYAIVYSRWISDTGEYKAIEGKITAGENKDQYITITRNFSGQEGITKISYYNDSNRTDLTMTEIVDQQNRRILFESYQAGVITGRNIYTEDAIYTYEYNLDGSLKTLTVYESTNLGTAGTDGPGPWPGYEDIGEEAIFYDIAGKKSDFPVAGGKMTYSLGYKTYHVLTTATGYVVKEDGSPMIFRVDDSALNIIEIWHGGDSKTTLTTEPITGEITGGTYYNASNGITYDMDVDAVAHTLTMKTDSTTRATFMLEADNKDFTNLAIVDGSLQAIMIEETYDGGSTWLVTEQWDANSNQTTFTRDAAGAITGGTYYNATEKASYDMTVNAAEHTVSYQTDETTKYTFMLVEANTGFDNLGPDGIPQAIMIEQTYDGGETWLITKLWDEHGNKTTFTRDADGAITGGSYYNATEKVSYDMILEGTNHTLRIQIDASTRHFFMLTSNDTAFTNFGVAGNPQAVVIEKSYDKGIWVMESEDNDGNRTTITRDINGVITGGTYYNSEENVIYNMIVDTDNHTLIMQREAGTRYTLMLTIDNNDVTNLTSDVIPQAQAIIIEKSYDNGSSWLVMEQWDANSNQTTFTRDAAGAITGGSYYNATENASYDMTVNAAEHTVSYQTDARTKYTFMLVEANTG